MTPTRVRYGMILATTGVAVMLYLDRVCLSIVQAPIRLDQNLSPREWNWLVSGFFLTYALFQLPAGWLGDRYGARVVLSAYLLLWSLCTGLMGLASGFTLLLALRLGCGLFEAGAYPLAAGVVRRWVPATARATASGCVAVGGRIGGAIAPQLTVALAAGTADGWRRPFLVYGAVGVVGAVVFYWWYRDRPDRHPAVNRAEAELIAGGTPPPDRGPVGWPPVGAFVAGRAVWLCSLVQFLANFAWVFVITKLPEFLQAVYGSSAEDAADYQSLPLYAGAVGLLCGGVISDAATRRLGPRWGRALPVAVTRLAVGGAFLGCVGAADPLTVAVLMAGMAMATDMGTAPVWAWGQDVGGRHVGGVIGWANMWGNLGAWLSPLVVGEIVAGYGDDVAAGWKVAFLLCAGLQIVAAVAALGIDARRPVTGHDRH